MIKTTDLILPASGTMQKSRTSLFLLSFMSTLFGGIVSSLMSIYLADVAKELLQNTDSQVNDNISATINAISIFGWTLGGITWGIFSDSIGRRKAFIYATLCYGLATILTGLSPNWMFVVLFRFISGFGIGGVLVITTMLISESYDEKRRAVLLGILSIAIPVGFFSAGLITYFVTNWRWAFMVGTIPVIFSILAAISIRESEKWKRAKIEESKITSRFTELFSGLNMKNLMIGSAVFGAPLIGLWATVSWLPLWIHHLDTGGDALRAGALAMMLVGAGGLTGGFISGWIVNAIGIRNTLLICFGASFLLSLILFKLTRQLSSTTYIQIAFLSLFFGMSQGALSIFIPELFPTSLSATATGVCFNLGRIFTGLAVFFIGALVDTLGGYGNSIFYFSFVFIIAFFVTLFSSVKK
ncbi:MAG: MFS transporter [Chitinophagales bacterium]